MARPIIKAKYISLVNLLAGEEVYPEYLTARDASGELVRWALAWLSDPGKRARVTASLRTLRRRVAQPGATDRAADHIVAWLRRHRAEIPAAAAADRPPASYHGPHDRGPLHERAEETRPHR